MNRLANVSVAGNNLSRTRYWLLLAALAASGGALQAQQPYSQYGSGDGQYAAPNQQYGYGQPQYAQPNYAQPQYQQPQYAQPQQYSQAQPYAQQQQQYSQAQPYAQQPQPYPQSQYDQPYAQPQLTQQPQQPLTADQLEQLVAPVALYPDQLLAQLLTAATYPAQVAAADQWLKQMGSAPTDQIAAGADAQANWDPSVKALTAFPQVLSMMDQNLQWTTSLGNAYYNQPQDVMQTVQLMRQRAEDAGNLRSTPQEQMTYDQGAIELAPPNPQVVYVPQYNPWYAYGAPVAPYPGFSLLGAIGSFFGGGAINYGLGIGIGAFENFPWGWLGWAFDWLGHSIFFNHSPYFTHSNTVADWGYPRGGARAYGGWSRDPRYANAGRGFQNSTRAGYGGNQYAARPAQAFGRTGEAVTRPTPQFARPQANGFSSNGFAGNQRGGMQNDMRGGTFDRGYQAQGFGAQNYGAARPMMPNQQAYNRAPETMTRPQAYAGGSAYGYNNRPAQTFAERPGMNYGSPAQAYRMPQSRAPQISAPPMSAPRGFAQEQPRSFAAAPQRSGGFFGHSSEPKNFGGNFGGGSFKAPKSFGGGGGNFKAPKNFGGGGSFKAPKESHSGGGGGRKR
jgi:hypothetical protein